MCFKPLQIRLKKKEMLREFPELFKPIHQGNYYPIKYRYVQCGECLDCVQKYSRNWVFRLKNEAKVSVNQTFLTLTYRPESLTHDNISKDALVLHKPHLQTFVKSTIRKQKRLLKSLNIQTPNQWPRLKYYACGEYGGKFMRPHYHIIFFNLHPMIAKMLKSTSYEYKKTDTWRYGNIDLEPLSDNGIIYATKYLGKDHHPENIKKDKMPFNIMTPNLGWSYTSPIHEAYHKRPENKNYSVPVSDYKIPMPDYYKPKFYSDALRPLLAELSIKEYKERIDECAKELNITPEQFEQRRQRIKTNEYNRKKREFLNNN